MAGQSVRIKGVSYDAGVVYGMNWRPVFEPSIVRRELQIIRDDLHCNAVRISARDPRRLVTTGEIALSLGLQTWFHPQCWDRGAAATARYLERAAAAVEALRARWPDRVVLCVASEVTLFNRGIVPGRSLAARTRSPEFFPTIKSGRHNGPLNDFLSVLVRAAKRSYRGPLSYDSLVWETVDWSPFDFVGIDHYLSSKIADRYLEMLRPALAQSKPVVITEFGFDTVQSGAWTDGFLDSAGLKPSIIDGRSQFLHQLPVVGRFVRPHLNGTPVRDEAAQARKLTEQLVMLEAAGVAGGFVSTFLSQITPYDPDPRFDLDMASSSLVKYFEHGQGTTYPDMPWEPKESFRALSEYYAK